MIEKLDGGRDTQRRIQLLRVPPEIREVGVALPIALEGREVRDVEAHERREEPPVDLRLPVAEQEALPRQALVGGYV
jgi:hypothetical protein